ncbi:MAG: DEAD/DEAH box helicase, partial [Planctomycetales bacterium]
PPTPKKPKSEASEEAEAVAETEATADSPSDETPKKKPPRATPPPPEEYTHLKPPSDVVKLEDRLYYLLQPPLESWVRGSEVKFPFKPFPYQFEGIAFLYPRHAALLADEMGLGKTMQTISAMRLMLRAGELKDVLLICPKPLVSNWRKEFELWAPEIPIMIIEGDQTKRRWQWLLSDVPVKIANYELAVRDRAVFEESDKTFDLVVLDEAQRIKNTGSATARTVNGISRRRSWALSGTPVENRPDDLVGIFEFLVPGHLSAEMKLRALGELAGDYILRRTKQEVLTDMPPRLVRDVDIDLTPEQWDSYQLAEDKGIVQLTELGKGLTIQHVFELVLRLKQICNFDSLTEASAKTDRLEADLEEVAASGQKALVFSQWVDSLEKMGKRLKRFKPLEYHGRIPHKRREGVIEQFRNDPDSSVLLMSYGAGGVGLNLQFATYVFLFDRWWNPAVEDQAINRAHRIGVAGPVTVTRFIAENTIEQRIDQILTDKREIFDTIFHGAAPPSAGLNKSEVFGLFQLKGPQGNIKIPA